MARRLRHLLAGAEAATHAPATTSSILFGLCPSVTTCRCRGSTPWWRATRSSFSWPQARLIVETDGWQAHGTRAAFERDRVRDATLITANWRRLRMTLSASSASRRPWRLSCARSLPE